MSLPLAEAARPAVDLEILAELRTVRAELSALREATEDLARRTLDPDDRRIGTSLVPMLGAIFRDGFAVADVLIVALGPTLHGKALCALISDRLTEQGGAKSLGRLLARLEGVRFRGYRLVAAGRVRGGCLWRVSAPSKAALRD